MRSLIVCVFRACSTRAHGPPRSRVSPAISMETSRRPPTTMATAGSGTGISHAITPLIQIVPDAGTNGLSPEFHLLAYKKFSRFLVLQDESLCGQHATREYTRSSSCPSRSPPLLQNPRRGRHSGHHGKRVKYPRISQLFPFEILRTISAIDICSFSLPLPFEAPASRSEADPCGSESRRDEGYMWLNAYP